MSPDARSSSASEAPPGPAPRLDAVPYIAVTPSPSDPPPSAPGRAPAATSPPPPSAHASAEAPGLAATASPAAVPPDRAPSPRLLQEMHRRQWYKDWLRDRAVEREDPFGFSSAAASRNISRTNSPQPPDFVAGPAGGALARATALELPE